MTGQTIGLEYRAVLCVDLDRFAKILRRKRLGVVPAVFRFGDILADKIVRQMTVDTGRRRVVTGLLPRIELRRHDMAVHTSGRGSAKIRETLPVVEGKRADANQDAAKSGQHPV